MMTLAVNYFLHSHPTWRCNTPGDVVISSGKENDCQSVFIFQRLRLYREGGTIHNVIHEQVEESNKKKYPPPLLCVLTCRIMSKIFFLLCKKLFKKHPRKREEDKFGKR